MSTATQRIRAEVCARAEGNCEACGKWVGLDGESGHLDHFWGRARSESVESCWLLCVGCDDDKTHNRPSASHWLNRFLTHCMAHKYTKEQLRAEDRLVFVQAKAGLAVRGCDV